jgi:dinitrogenase iron-molybdenum cofactor
MDLRWGSRGARGGRRGERERDRELARVRRRLGPPSPLQEPRAHHARVAGFLREHAVDAVATNHMGADMENILIKLGIEVRLGAAGRAREAGLAVP